MSPEPSPSISNMDIDSLVHCASYLTHQDVANMASSCKFLNQVAYSDLIWQRFFRERWPQLQPSGFLQKSGAREAYLSRHTDLHQFKFLDPLVADLYTDSKPFIHIYLNRNNIFFSQGSLIKVMNIERFLNKGDSLVTLSDHRARITCMRLFPLHETSLFRSDLQMNENVLVTSSCDHSIRLWWKGCSQRCFRGHNGPVFALSDKLLGDGATKVFASGGEDGTVRLWSLSSSGKRGQHALKATLYGHEKSVVLTSVAGHNTSLLVSMSKDSKVRVWDAATASSSVRDSSCVGRTSVPGTPVSLKCHDSLLYVAAGSSVSAVDLRTMKKVFSTDNTLGKLYSFEIMPSKYLVCTGRNGRAMLWDIRKISDQEGADPINELDGHDGPVTHLHMDRYKIVTGGPKDSYINVWEAGTGEQTNSLICSDEDGLGASSGCSAMAVDGCRIVTGSSNGEFGGVLRFRDFDKATNRVSSDSFLSEDFEIASKFWGPQCYSDGDESE